MKNSKILIIDDEPANVLLLERILESAGYTNFLSTTDPREVEILMEDFQPDLLLLDLHMPYIDGFAILERLQELIPAHNFLPVLVLTADATSRAKIRALSSGATDFLVKPFDTSEVTLRVGNLLRTRVLHRQVQTHNENLERVVAQRTAELQSTLRQLEAMQQQVIEQERLRAFEVMAGGVAHDFNNVLSIVLGCSEVLMLECERNPASHKSSRLLENIITAARDGAEMVRRLATFYRPTPSPDERSLIDLVALAKQAVELTRPKWTAQALANGQMIDVVADVSPVPPVFGHASSLREALTNLIFNAVDAMPEGGTITVRTFSAGDDVVLSVSDTGTGMSEEVRRRCLEPFFTTKEHRGTGLGLAMVYGIVERHGGKLNIESTLGIGTSFTIRLPVHLGTQTEEKDDTPAVDRPLNILVADDHPLFCQAVSQYLRYERHTIETASDGVDALEKFRAGNFDLVLTDHAMPRMTGHELAHAIKSDSPRTPIIMITGFGEFLPDAKSVTKVVDRIVSKPFSAFDLRRSIAQVVAR